MHYVLLEPLEQNSNNIRTVTKFASKNINSVYYNFQSRSMRGSIARIGVNSVETFMNFRAFVQRRKRLESFTRRQMRRIIPREQATR